MTGKFARALLVIDRAVFRDAAECGEALPIRVATTADNRSEIMQLVDIYRGEIVDVTHDNLIVQIVGNEERVDSLIDLLSHFGITEMVRTGPVSMARGQREGAYRRSTAVWRAQANGKDAHTSERFRTGGV